MMVRAVTCICIFVCLFSKAYSQSSCPPNLDFESGTFNNWECFTGTVDTTPLGKNRMNLSPSAPVSGRHEIISRASNPGLDQYGGFPKLCPYGGNYSVRLGNDQTGAEAEALSYSFVVPSTIDTFTFTYFYAVVLQDPAHTPPEQPRFFVTAYDVITGELINCASYDYISTAALPGFIQSPGNPEIIYKGWTPTSLQFAGMGGHTVRLEFRTADCTRTGHFGYAYMDIASACSNILATAPYCIETNSLILDAPFGFKNYTWYNADFSTIVGTDQSITMSPPPVTTGVFYVDVEPYPGFGCRDTLQAYVKPMAVPDTPDVEITNLCQFQNPVPPLTASVLSGHQLLWYSSAVGGMGTSTAPVPPVSATGTSTYWVSMKELFGCEGFRREMTVKVHPTPAASFNINKIRQCQDGNSFTFTSTSTNLHNPYYTWEFGNGQSQTSITPSAVYSFTGHGNFSVKLKTTNDSACSTEQTQMVTVVPKPVAQFAYPSPLCENTTLVALQDRSYVPGGFGNINKWWWNINGQIVQGQTTPPPATAAAGPFPVKIAVSTTEGCKSDTNTTILNIRYNPIASFGFGDLMCNNEMIRFSDKSYMPPNDPNREQITKWYWSYDNGATSAAQNPVLNFSAGTHRAKLISETMAGCKSLPVERSFEIFPKPTIKLDISDSCVFVPITYTASVLTGNVVKWDWRFDHFITGGFTTLTNITRTQNYAGSYPVTLLGYSDKGCKDTIIRPFSIFDNKSFAGRDTAGPYNEPVQLDAHGEPNMQYTWSPQTGLNRWDIEKPIATYDKEQLYKLYTVTEKGCKKQSQVLVKRYAGPELYVPDAFTPNNDGVNDKLKVIPTGIKSFGFLAVYNRWGQLIYRTTNHLEGWDGTFRGEKLSSETFVYVVQATDYKGRPLHRKGTVILLR